MKTSSGISNLMSCLMVTQKFVGRTSFNGLDLDADEEILKASEPLRCQVKTSLRLLP